MSGLMPRQRLGQIISRTSNLPHLIGRRRWYIGIQRQIRDRQTMIGAMNPGNGAIVVIVVVVAAAAVGRIVVIGHVTALLRALQTIVILFGDMTARRRETVSQIGTTTTLVARCDRATITRALVKIVRLLSHLLQILEGTKDLLVKYVALFACVISGTHICRASYHRHPVHLLAHLDHNLISQQSLISQL